MTTATAARPEVSQALALLTVGHTIHATAEHTGLPLNAIRGLINGQRGWLFDPTSERAYDPSQSESRPLPPASVRAEDLDWARGLLGDSPPVALPAPRPARPRPTPAPEPPPAPRLGDVDALLARAADNPDTAVQTALRTTRAAIETLRERLETVTARAAALTEIAELEQQLVAARLKAKALGVRITKTSPPTAPLALPPTPDPTPLPAPATDRDDSWEPGREPDVAPARTYIAGVDYRPGVVRAWAKTAGYGYPRRGRFLPGALVQAWIDATGGAA